MLELEKLTGTTFDEIAEQAARRIGRSDCGWNNLQPQDPGMTLVDLFSWLKALQHEYLSQILPETRRRFLSLLDVRPANRQGASALIKLGGAREDLLVPGETSWPAGEISFENPEPAVLFAAKLVSVRFGQNPAVLTDAFDGARRFGLFPRTEGEKPAFTLHFDRPLPPDVPIRLYFEIPVTPGRNPVEDGDFVPLGEIRCEALTEAGWVEAAVLRDETHGFLFSGLVCLRLKSRMARGEEGYSIRFVLETDCYDFPPETTGIHENVLRIWQRETLCRTDFAEDGALLSYHLHLCGGHRVFLPEQGRWRETEDFALLPEEGGVRLRLPVSGKALVLSYAREKNLPVLGSGQGFTGQSLSFPWKDAMEIGLLVGERDRAGRILWDCWEQRADFYASGPGDCHFVCNPAAEELLFGDQERGAAPRKGKDNILLGCLRRTAGPEGNIRRGLIGPAQTGNGKINALTVRQLTAAEGGKRAETLEEAEERALQRLSSEAAVTAADYRKAVLETGGLLVRGCRVLAGRALTGEERPPDGCLENRRVRVVVQGGGGTKEQNAAYEINIRRKLDKIRLAATPVEICWPVLIRLQISGRIVAAPHYADAEARVQARILAFLEECNRSFGSPFSYGDFYCALDLLECVQMVEALTVEPLNGAVSKTQADDLVIPFNGLYALGGLELDIRGAV